jgi:hypothetical protein
MRIAGWVGGLVLLGVLAGCGGPGKLPDITMTSGGGFAGSASTWRIAPDGTWQWQRVDKGMPAVPPRSGRLTDTQRDELAALANDPDLYKEARLPHAGCNWSDGDYENLTVGSLHYLASWCPEHRPNIDRIRDRIKTLTTG